MTLTLAVSLVFAGILLLAIGAIGVMGSMLYDSFREWDHPRSTDEKTKERRIVLVSFFVMSVGALTAVIGFGLGLIISTPH